MGYSGTSGSWNGTTSDGMLNPVWDDPPSHNGAPTAGEVTGGVGHFVFSSGAGFPWRRRP